MEIYLEQATANDVGTLLELAKSTFADTFLPLNNPADFADYMARAFTVENFLTELSDPMTEFWLAKAGTGMPPVGYFKINKNRPHDAFIEERKTDGRLCELERIYVRANQKGRGIGQKLLIKAIFLAKQDCSDWLWLGVWEKNHPALAFYEAQNFEIFGKHHFSIGDDIQVDLLMRRAVGL